MNIQHNKSLILGSKSPRRKLLLEQAGLRFEVCESTVDEDLFPVTTPKEYTIDLARAKAGEVADRFCESWIIGADTIVVLDNEVLEKPRSTAQAKEMLTTLSGRVHTVYTGYAVICRDDAHEFSSVAQTEVLFKSLSSDEISWYIQTPEPYDKAGGYAIQGLGAMFVAEVNGSYTNVVGLPVCAVVDHLICHDVISFDNPTGESTV